jgi:RNA polymerase sigma-70 factor, ECF subfamily
LEDNNKDIELIGGIVAGREEAFRTLVETYKDYVFRVCMSFVHHVQEAEDLAQEVFIEIFESAGKFRQESKLSTWIYKIAVNKTINHIRRRKRSEWFNILDPLYSSREKRKIEAPDYDEADYGMERDEKHRYLYDSIDSLPTNQKVAFTLHKLDGMSYQEIASVMDLSLSSVESLIHRAKMNLQKKLYHYFRKQD